YHAAPFIPEEAEAMRRTPVVVAVLAALCALGGCATSGNLFGKRQDCRLYGGTQTDAALIAGGLHSDSELSAQPGMERPVAAWAACCGLMDLPLSLVADTVTLPVTLPVVLSRMNEEDRSREKAAKKELKKPSDE